jgi:hypothetical protein
MTSSKRRHGASLYLGAVVFLLIIVPNFGWGQTNSPARLPPPAQEALDKGIIAAKVPDYPLAIRFFEDARKIAPTAPVVFMNLGIAESKLPGRELRAIAWFGAYLATVPGAPNAAAVKEQIAVLEVRNKSNVSRLIKVVQDAASQIPEDTRGPTMGRDKGHILYQVSRLWARIGDIANAQKTAKLITKSASWQDSAYEAIAGAQFVAGDSAGALQTAGAIHDKNQQQAIRKAIAEVPATAKPASRTAVEVEDWLREMGVGTWPRGASDRPWIVGPLTADMFLDLGGYLKSLPSPSKSIYAYFWALQETADKIVTEQEKIGQMLKQQTNG